VMKPLKELEGTVVAIIAPAVLGSTEMQKVKLHLVEDSGIWIESQSLTDKILQSQKVTMAPKTLVFFVPWSQITFVLSSLDMPSISERAGAP
jgi:hypothetical protein